jgi:hypothetical protein
MAQGRLSRQFRELGGHHIREESTRSSPGQAVRPTPKYHAEPIFEADFLPCSYGFRPKHRTHDAVAEVRHLTSHSYEWIVEGDIKACLDAWSYCSVR